MSDFEQNHSNPRRNSGTEGVRGRSRRRKGLRDITGGRYGARERTRNGRKEGNVGYWTGVQGKVRDIQGTVYEFRWDIFRGMMGI